MRQFSKYKLITYGCQMNEYDSEVIASMMEAMGAEPTQDEDEAGVIILNTCCVRNTADNKVYGRLGQYKKLKDRRPELLIAVLGCLAQKDKESLIKRYPHVDLVLGTHNLDELTTLLELAGQDGPLTRANDQGASFLSPGVRKPGVTGYIPISIGCDCFCTFCIVPHVRGRIKSRPFHDITAEAGRLAGSGCGEIFLLGQNVNTYGFDLPEKPGFASLLRAVDAIPGVRRIRFTSPHPRDFSPDLTNALGQLKHVCPSVHLPLQAGSDPVLFRMNRRYDTRRYMEIVEALRQSVPGLALSTDIIVGFPGETDEEFEEGLEFIQKVGFDQAFMFAYSPRTGTPAEKMPGQVPHDVKMSRLYRLIQVQNDITREKNRQQVGNEVEVLVEGVSRKDPSRVTGRTGTNKVVNFPGKVDLTGSFVTVRLTQAFTWGFMGEMAGTS
jgi:tRNA-2-methylthio-N6-dimethylallyladenosine synthase